MTPRPWPLALAGAVLLLSGCYAPQRVDLSADVSRWRATQTMSEARVADGESWTADALVTRAMEANPDLLAGAARVAAARRGSAAAGEFDDLELRLTQTELADFEKGRPRLNLAFRGRPPRPGEVETRRDAARLRADELSARHLAAQQALRAQVRQLHAEVLLADRELDLLRAEEALRVAYQELEAKRLLQSASNKLALALAELARAEASDAAAQVAVRRARALNALRVALDLPVDSPLTLAGAPGGVEPEQEALRAEERATWVADALSARAALRETGAALGRARADRARAAGGLWPWLGWVELSYEITDDSGPLSFGMALSLDLPLHAWSGAETEAADAAVRHRQIAHDGAMSRVTREVEAAFGDAMETRARLDTLRDLLLKAVTEAKRLTNQSPQGPIPDRAQTMRLELTGLSAQRREVRALRDWINARIRLDEAAAR